MPLMVFLILCGSITVQAKVSGKISGVVTNSETGEPIVGATVSVAETDLATKTDEDGEYFIINVPVGHYDLVVSHVGFERMVKTEVRVLVDLTTPEQPLLVGLGQSDSSGEFVIPVPRPDNR